MTDRTSSPSPEMTPPQGLWQRVTALGRPFWMLCTMEMWERLAYYGVRVVVGVYIAQADVPGGLHWTQADRANIFFWWSIFQSVLPTFTGGLADRYGYKRTIFVSVTLKMLGYLLMATQRGYTGFFLGAMTLATGTALFKPGIQGSIAHNVRSEQASSAWGIFYWLVNVGAMIGPAFASFLRGDNQWPRVFYGCAAVVALNYLMLLTYREPESGYDTSKNIAAVMADTFRNFFEPRLLAFLTIMTGFWLMMYQLWDFHPLFITDWIDSRAVSSALPVPETWLEPGRPRGNQIGQEHLLNLNAFLIVLFVVPVSAAVAKLRTLTAMFGGMIMATCGILVSGLTSSGWMLLFGILLFSMGEMLTGPKKNQYLAAIAPPGKKALYLGYVNIPVGIGGALGAKLTGWLYANFGEKAMLAQRYLAEHPELLGRDKTWNGDVATLEATTGVSRTKALATLTEKLGIDNQATTELLWSSYDPWKVWLPIAAIGVASVVALGLFNRAATRWTDLNH